MGRKGTRDRGEGGRDIAEGTRNRSQSPEEKGGEENTILTSQARPDCPDGFTFWSPSEPLTKHAALLSILLSTRCASPFSCLQGPPSLFLSLPSLLLTSSLLSLLLGCKTLSNDYTFRSFQPPVWIIISLVLSSRCSHHLPPLSSYPLSSYPLCSYPLSSYPLCSSRLLLFSLTIPLSHPPLTIHL